MKTNHQENCCTSPWEQTCIIGLLLLTITILCFTNVSHAETTAECEIPNHVVCDYYDPEGIHKIVVTADYGQQGKVNIVNEQFGCSTSATISYDPVAGLNAYNVVVTPCNNGSPPARLQWAPKDKSPFKTKTFRVVPDNSSRKILSKPIVTDYLKVVHPEGVTNGVTLWCDTIAACEIQAKVCGAIGGVGTCYGSYCECQTQAQSETKTKSSVASRF